MKRRTLLQILASMVVALPARVGLRAQSASLSEAHVTRVRAIADVVLPQEIGDAARASVVDRFLVWLQNYRAGAQTDHGYGFPRLRRTAASPVAKYTQQLTALGDTFTALPLADRTRIIAAAIDAAGLQRLPSQPDGSHIASDLMAFYFHSVEANDLCYRARIGRDTCRGLDGSENRPQPISGGQ